MNTRYNTAGRFSFLIALDIRLVFLSQRGARAFRYTTN
jgi:hypothetical protein